MRAEAPIVATPLSGCPGASRDSGSAPRPDPNIPAGGVGRWGAATGIGMPVSLRFDIAAARLRAFETRAETASSALRRVAAEPGFGGSVTAQSPRCASPLAKEAETG